jgi:hypothetical protein
LGVLNYTAVWIASKRGFYNTVVHLIKEEKTVILLPERRTSSTTHHLSGEDDNDKDNGKSTATIATLGSFENIDNTNPKKRLLLLLLLQ